MHEMELIEAEEIWIFRGVIYDRNQTIYNWLWSLEFLIGVGLVWWKLKVGGMNIWSDLCCMPLPWFILFCVSPLCVFGSLRQAMNLHSRTIADVQPAGCSERCAVKDLCSVQYIWVVLVGFQEQCRTIYYIELPFKQITKYNDGNIIMFSGRFITISTLPSSVGAARA